MKNLATTIKNVFFTSLVSLVAFSASAKKGVEIVSDGYLYESLIQAEFEIDTQTEHSIVTSTANLDATRVLEIAKTEIATESSTAD